MKVLIVFAHPNRSSFNGAILEQIERGLTECAQAYTVIDLYQEHFDPVLVFNDQLPRRELRNDPEMAHYRELVTEADQLIFIYPVWWGSMPAILKGFFDRVFVSGFAYDYKGSLAKGMLRKKSAWVFYTMDTPEWFAWVVRRSFEWTVMRTGILKFCGIHPVRRVVFAGVRSASAKQRAKWLDQVYRRTKDGL